MLRGGATPLDEKVGLIVQTWEQTGGYYCEAFVTQKLASKDKQRYSENSLLPSQS